MTTHNTPPTPEIPTLMGEMPYTPGTIEAIGELAAQTLGPQGTQLDGEAGKFRYGGITILGANENMPPVIEQ